MDAEKSEIASFVDGTITEYSDLIMRAERLDKIIQKLQAAKRRTLESIDEIKSQVKSDMLERGDKKIEGAEFSWVLKRGQVVVDLFDEDIVPEIYRPIKITTNIDKALVRQALEAGIDVPGARLKESYALQPKQKSGDKELEWRSTYVQKS